MQPEHGSRNDYLDRHRLEDVRKKIARGLESLNRGESHSGNEIFDELLSRLGEDPRESP